MKRNTIYLAIIEQDDERSYSAFTDKSDAEDFLVRYMAENLEYYADEDTEIDDLSISDWADLTDFQEWLEIKEIDLDYGV